MRCSHPHYTIDLGLKENGKRNLKFIGFNPDLSSLKQLSARYGKSAIVPLPCGNCLACRLNKSKEWAVRCVLESLQYEENYFLTLTYDDAHLPTDGRLQREDVQKFLKRARAKFGQFRYFGCGEYGSKNKRPHYHLILFGCHIDDLKAIGSGLYESKKLTSLWIDTKTKESLGYNFIGFVSYASCNYVAQYTTKKVFGDVSDEFLMASTDPGIGYNWCKEHLQKVLDYDAVFGPFGSSKVAKMPRYFEKMAQVLDDAKYIEVKARRLDKSTAMNVNNMLVHACDEFEKLLDYEARITLDEFIAKKRGKSVMIWNFIKVYWREVLNVATIILAIVLWCIRKKPVKVIDTLKEVIVRVLPSLICMAENTGLKGSDKLKLVLDELAKTLRDLNYGDDVIDQYLPFAAEQVELILSTPQKKKVR